MTSMRAVAIHRFGGAEEMTSQALPVPTVGPGEVMIRVAVAGVGEWDPFEREGGYAEMLGITSGFPYVLGSEGSGVVVAVGEQVDRFREGDDVYAVGFLNPKGGFYAEYVVVDAALASRIPRQLSMEQAGVMSGVSITALRGLDDTLELKAGEAIAIVGASGGIGHVAVQLATRLGARVFAVASGADGVALAERLGADVAVDGHADDVAAAARTFAPSGIDAVLLAVGGDVAEQVLSAVGDGGRVAYPTGVRPAPRSRRGVDVRHYDGGPDRRIIDRLERLIGTDPFEVHVARTFELSEAADAHGALGDHYLGKLALRIG